jgi:hypothetical protein
VPAANNSMVGQGPGRIGYRVGSKLSEEVPSSLGAPTTIWVLIGASRTGPTSEGQPNVEDFEAGSMGGRGGGGGLSAPSGPGNFLACHRRGGG